MIARLRRAHRAIHRIAWLPIFLLFVAALSSRRPVEIADDGWAALPAAAHGSGTMRTPTSAPRALLGTSTEAFGIWPARLSVWTDGTLEIEPLRPLDRPELLIYWLSDPLVGETLPDSAQLLGRLAGTATRRFRLPPSSSASPGDPGILVVYSLGHQQVVATARLASLATAPSSPSVGKDGA